MNEWRDVPRSRCYDEDFEQPGMADFKVPRSSARLGLLELPRCAMQPRGLFDSKLEQGLEYFTATSLG